MKRFYFVFLLALFSGCGGCFHAEKDRPATSVDTDSTTVVVPDTAAVTVTDSAKKDTVVNLGSSGIRHVKILYGTDRKEVRINGNFVKYLEASSDLREPYKVGYAIVTIPPDHVPGGIERPSIWKMEFSEDSTKHMINKSIVKLSNKDFDALLRNISNGSEGFIFVHGFNNSFKDAALRTAQITEDIGLPIVPMMFSWSSNGEVLKYSSDATNVRMAVPAFMDFMKRVYALGRFKKIHLVAHSMGNELISKAMYELRNDPLKLKFDQVIMAAPDVYAEEFKRDYAPAIRKRANRVTVYSAKNDWALKTSHLLHSNLRLGQVGFPPFLVNGVDIIDAIKVKTDFLGHGKFAESEAIMNDINKLFLTGLDPIRRGVLHQKVGNMDYYYFKRWGHE